MTERVFLPDGTFVPPSKLATEPLLKLREQAAFDVLGIERDENIHYARPTAPPAGRRAALFLVNGGRPPTRAAPVKN